MFHNFLPSNQHELKEKSKSDWQYCWLLKGRGSIAILCLNVSNSCSLKNSPSNHFHPICICIPALLWELCAYIGLLEWFDTRVSVSSKHPQSCCFWLQVISPFCLSDKQLLLFSQTASAWSRSVWGQCEEAVNNLLHKQRRCKKWVENSHRC